MREGRRQRDKNISAARTDARQTLAGLHRSGDRVKRGGVQVAESLRIAIFVHEFPALSETFVLNQVTGLLDLGHEVTIFAIGPRRDPLVHPDVLSYGLHERLHYRDMPASRVERLLKMPGIVFRWPPGHRKSLLKSLNLSRYGGDARSLSLLYWSNRLSKHADFDIIHCHFGTVGREVAFLREIGAIRGKLVVSFHGVDMSVCVGGGEQIYRHLFEHGDMFLPISDRWKRRLIEMGSDPARTWVHRMGVDIQRFPFQAGSSAPGRPGEILSIGRLVEKKGIEYGLRAVASLLSRGVPVRYSVVGDGPLRARLESLACELGISHAVAFLGYQDQERVVELVRASDVLLAPSVTDSKGDQEGIPVALMEAMASGVPVVSTYHSGIPELVTSGVTGFLAEERDVEGLARALHDLIEDSALCKRIAVAGREKVAAAFDVHVLNKQLEAHYHALVAAPGSWVPSAAASAAR